MHCAYTRRRTPSSSVARAEAGSSGSSPDAIAVTHPITTTNTTITTITVTVMTVMATAVTEAADITRLSSSMTAAAERTRIAASGIMARGFAFATG